MVTDDDEAEHFLRPIATRAFGRPGPDQHVGVQRPAATLFFVEFTNDDLTVALQDGLLSNDIHKGRQLPQALYNPILLLGGGEPVPWRVLRQKRDVVHCGYGSNYCFRDEFCEVNTPFG